MFASRDCAKFQTQERGPARPGCASAYMRCVPSAGAWQKGGLSKPDILEIVILRGFASHQRSNLTIGHWAEPETTAKICLAQNQVVDRVGLDPIADWRLPPAR